MIAERLAARRPRRLMAVGSHEVRTRLELFARARTRQAMPTWAMRAVVVGVAVDLVVLLVCTADLSLHALPRSISPTVLRFALDARYWMVGPPLVLAALGLLAASFRRAPLARVAREADSLLDLRERLSTALELESVATLEPRSASSGMLALRQRADAVDALRRHEPAEAYPIRLRRREVIATALACLLLFGLVLVPEVTGQSDRQLAEIAARTEADQLASLANQIANDPSLSPEDRAALASALAQAAQSLEASAGDSQSALSALGSSERSLAQQAATGGGNSQLALSRVADALDQAAASKAVASKIDAGDFAGAAQALSQLGDQAGSLSQSDRSALAGALSKAASGTSQLDPKLSDKLQQAASSLGDNAQQSPKSAFSQAGDALKQAGQSAAQQASLDQALSALQSAKASIGSAQSGAADTGRAEASSASGASSNQSQTGDPGSQDAQGSGQGDASAAGGGSPNGQTPGQNGQSAGDSAGGSAAGKGSLAKQGQNPSEDFRSRVVKVPTDQFGDPSVSSGQASSEGPVGEATVDYRQVLANYQKRATDAMSQGSIPASLKDLVSAYFTSLDSGRGAASGAGR